MFIYYNPNRLGKRVGDCAVRAVSKALNVDWDFMGRYSNEQYSREGYSRGENDQFKSQLHELMAQAPSGTIRQELQKISSMAGNM